PCPPRPALHFSLHDALPISVDHRLVRVELTGLPGAGEQHGTGDRFVRVHGDAGVAGLDPVQADVGHRVRVDLQLLGTGELGAALDRKSTRLNSSHVSISYAV